MCICSTKVVPLFGEGFAVKIMFLENSWIHPDRDTDDDNPHVYHFPIKDFQASQMQLFDNNHLIYCPEMKYCIKIANNHSGKREPFKCKQNK